MAALMSTSSAFAGMKVQARVTVRSQRAQTVIMANAGAGPKRVSTRNQHTISTILPAVEGVDERVASVRSAG